MSKIRYCTYNVGDAFWKKLLSDFRRMVHEYDPDFIAVQEVGDRGHLLRKAAKQLDRLLIRDGSQPASDHIAFLVGPDVRIRWTRLVKISGPEFVGHNTAGARKSGWVGAKYALIVNADIRGENRTVITTHLVPSAGRKGNHRTRALHNRQVAALAALLDTLPDNTILMGDMNAEANSSLMDEIRQVATIRSVKSRGNRDIDHQISKGLDGYIRALKGYASDHRPVLFTEKGEVISKKHRGWKFWPEFRLAILNLPRHRNKRALVAPWKRPRIAMRLMRARRRSIVGINELDNSAYHYINGLKNWAVHVGAWNNVFSNGVKIGNGIAYRTDIYNKEWAGNKRTHMPGRPRGLNHPTICLRNKKTRNTIRVICFHAPRRKTNPATNRKVIVQVLRRMRKWRRRGVTAAAIGDGNNGKLRRYFRQAKMRVLSFGRVEIVATVNARKRRKAKVLKGKRNGKRFSDHPVPTGSVNR